MSRQLVLLVVAVGQLSTGGFAAPLAVCPGQFVVGGLGNVSLVPSGWASEEGAVMSLERGRKITAHLGGRGYFASHCTAGTYDNAQYLALDLRDKTLTYTADISGAGCGCNAGFYLVSMRQNEKATACGDHFCDAQKVCGESCAEIDIQESNQFAWHSTLHSANDHHGLGKGLGGGGATWTGARDWSSADYGPGGRCIDTSHPFQVSVSFPMDAQGILLTMDVTLTQVGKNCPLAVSLGHYVDMAELDAALAAGMTPVVSYWGSTEMAWLDGRGADGKGACDLELPDACADSVSFYDFAVIPAFTPSTPSPDRAAGGGAGSGGSSWGRCLLAAFVGGILVVVAMEALAILGVWAMRRYRMRNGTSLLRSSSLPSVTSLQNLAALADGGQAPSAFAEAGGQSTAAA
eukprot:CAMPEP_0171070770 /NCGR_PEP_ID=MMETSP0766_2-20121228/9938_1 /TAXON_ID=439317 /ORGANISM="Gambierdiscus australes, Strain CAWD 149" /LENGTH=404 /DNA_ID=CAMNT_0011527277 /DNA_START=58 /DNA_END=1272 /DNA_ORIENTATION=+